MNGPGNNGNSWALPIFIASSVLAAIACFLVAFSFLGQSPQGEVVSVTQKDASATSSSNDRESSSTSAKGSVRNQGGASGTKEEDPVMPTGTGGGVFSGITGSDGNSDDDSSTSENPPADEEKPKDSSNASRFPKKWEGKFDGYASDGGSERKYMEVTFSTVDEDGRLRGVCSIDSDSMGPGEIEGSYNVEGRINWETRDIEFWGTSWVDKGIMNVMRRYSGTVNEEYDSIYGHCETTDGKGTSTWEMSSVD